MSFIWACSKIVCLFNFLLTNFLHSVPFYILVLFVWTFDCLCELSIVFFCILWNRMYVIWRPKARSHLHLANYGISWFLSLYLKTHNFCYSIELGNQTHIFPWPCSKSLCLVTLLYIQQTTLYSTKGLVTEGIGSCFLFFTLQSVLAAQLYSLPSRMTWKRYWGLNEIGLWYTI